MPIRELPEFLAVVPELAAVEIPAEPLASCSSCAMVRTPLTDAHAHRTAFTARSRCCTYHPSLPNYRVGRALRRGGVGAEKIRARLASTLEGVTARRLGPPKYWMERYMHARKVGRGFGTDDMLECPYWMEGPLGCSVHADREAVCRTWQCKHVDGAAGRELWNRLGATLEGVEDLVSRHLAELPDAPGAGATAEELEAWYLLCAERADRLTDTDIASMRRPGIVERAQKVVDARAEIDRTMPDVLAPSVQHWHREEGIGPDDPPTWALSSWSGYDLVKVPIWIFGLLSKMDGRTPWRVARDAAAAELGVEIPDALVASLWRTRLLWDPQDLNAPPGASMRVPGGKPDVAMGADREG